jgi:fructosamine-3-kinase
MQLGALLRGRDERFLHHRSERARRSGKVTRLEPVFFKKVIPRLLGALEHEGLEAKPCLVHCDLWRGNFSEGTQTGELVIFDACAFWGHYECA